MLHGEARLLQLAGFSHHLADYEAEGHDLSKLSTALACAMLLQCATTVLSVNAVAGC